MPYFRKFAGARLFLSPIDVNDAEQYAAWINDSEVARQLNALPNNYTVDKEREALQRLAGGHHFAIVEARQEKLLGNCGLDSIDWIHGTAELGIFIGDKEYWGKGYGTEAIGLLLHYGFAVLNLHNIMLQVNSDNQRAQRCYENLGFQVVGRRQYLRRGETRLDSIIMDLLAPEYFAAQRRKTEELERDAD